MSVLNVCSTDLDNERRHYRSHISVPDHRISSFYRRFSWNYQQSHNSSTGSYYDTYSNSSISSKNSSLEVIFSRLLDVLIFTSAIAITAYSYLTGSLDAPSPFVVEAPPMKIAPFGVYSNRSYKRHSSKRDIVILQDPIEESRRQRTQEWAEQQLHPQDHHHHHHHHHHQTKRHSAPMALLDNNRKIQSPKLSRREKKRAQSIPNNKPVEKEDDEMFSRMEERLQSLIEQGQAALTSQIDDLCDTDHQSMVSNRKCCT
ncbi:hypothetical protein K501DRAFT_339088 [Backusella circina FSU 941]|nr:hypothetical protein K501DRAFT_339088 [Backusella circina FSU 941]